MIARWLYIGSLGFALTLSSVSSAKERQHTVYAGQRLGSIAKRYNISVEVLCAANGITPKDIIKPGQKLVIPAKGATVESVKKSAGPAEKPASRTEEKSNAAPEAAPAKPASEPKPAPAAKQAPTPKAKQAPWQVHTITSGQRLGSIAKRYRVSIDALAYANGIAPNDTIKPNQKLVIPRPEDSTGEAARQARLGNRVAGLEVPGANKKPAEAKKSAGPSWAKYERKPLRRGYVTLIGHTESWKGFIIAEGGKLNPGARLAVARVMSASNLKGGIDDRLIRLLAEVSDKFGGRPIRVVSGHRTASYARASRHAVGQALDFSIPGIPNDVLRDYLLTYDEVGVGYYPNSSFVHFDVRKIKTYWVDQSGPGEAPRYSYIGRGPDNKQTSTNTKRSRK